MLPTEEAHPSSETTLRRIAVIGPDSMSGVLSADAFVQLLVERLGLEAFSIRPQPGLELAGADAPLALATSGRGTSTPAVLVDADTVIWLHFAPTVYLCDWLAGWFDVLLNGSKGVRRRSRRASLATALGALVLRTPELGAEQIDSLRRSVRLIELSSPAQAHFWLRMQEARAQDLPQAG